MKVVQTFWSGYKNPLVNDYGWVSPQFHLMSWTLSCLSLKENYKEVIMYTDSVGYRIFSEMLELPYTDIIIKYDNLTCPEAHWAYPKLLTYSLQESPFIHVDGDVYLPKRLTSEIESGELITQNKEIGSSYYKNMMDAIRDSNIFIPDYIEKELLKDSISSYNAGIIGGNNIKFIKEYCKNAFDFIAANSLTDRNCQNINVNHNILFEQILFYVLSEKFNKKVLTILEHSIKDNGYTYSEFCDFNNYNECALMHIIGGHKRNQKVCDLLSQTLLYKYPEYHKRIIKLFSKQHI